MGSLSRNLRIVRLMLSEERRLNSAMIGKAQFLFFPVMIIFMSFVLGLSSKQLISSMPMDRMYTILHGVILIYGLGVGGFALFGERIAQKRFGDISMMLETPKTLPIDFRSVFLAFYVKDTIYYMLYSIIPLVIGLGLTIPLTGFKVTSVLFLLLTITLTFLLGISLSFFISTLYVRSRAAFAVGALASACILLGGYANGSYDLTDSLPPLAFQLTTDPLYALASLLLTVAFSFLAVHYIKIKFGKATERYSEEMLATAERFSFAKGHSTLMAKDWIDLIRSKTLMPVVGAYVGPLAFLAVLFWFLGDVLMLPLHFNLIFYAAMIGFFGVSIYGWLNLLDTAAFMQVLPVSVEKVIRTKLLLFCILAAAMSTIFLAVLSVLQMEVTMIWVALIVAYSTTLYTVTSTAYLTGLRTNSYLFDPKVLAKFAALVIPPLIVLTILSFEYESDASLSLPLMLAICGILALATFFAYRRIGRRWARESFTF